ncbi:MAG TPA: cyclic nucleotide-binding domain-containing protein [Acidimicrobiia bacterium]|jgi:CRP-like cAMP-binding protein|nr:cyclic nucleotide-binding domain-containing protein [Acidimicrobiia bacterium]
MARPTTDELLARVPLFRDLSKRHLRQVRSLATRVDVQPGRVLTREGGTGHEFIVVLEGEVEIRRGDKVIATRGAGDYVGEIALIEGRPRTATVVATSPAVLDVIGQREFAELLVEEPEIADRIRATAAQRLEEDARTEE